MRGCLALLWLGFSVVTQLHAATWYVDCTRPSDDGDGQTWESAKKSIQSAIDCAANSDIIFVKSGTYAPICATHKTITIQSTDGFEKAHIDGRFTAPCAQFGSTNSVIIGFTLRNGVGRRNAVYDVDPVVDADGPLAGGLVYATAKNCRIVNNRGVMYAAGGAYGSVLVDCIVADNRADNFGGGARFTTFHQSVVFHNQAYAGGGAYRSTLSRTRVTDNKATLGGGAAESTLANCIVSRNEAQQDGAGVYACALHNCTVVKNHSWGGVGGAALGENPRASFNSLIWDNYPSDIVDSLNGFWLEKGNYCGVDAQGIVNIEPPRFVDEENLNVQLLPESPCLDQGVVDGDAGTLDYRGEMRIQDGHIDIGAYEGRSSGILVATRVRGAGLLTPQSPVVAGGSSVTFQAIEFSRPFLAFHTNGVFATTNKIFTVSNISTSLSVVAMFQPCEIFVDSLRTDDNGDGLSWNTAKKTIQAAVEMAADGDRVVVKAGVYKPFRGMNKSILIESEHIGGAVVDGLVKSEREFIDEMNRTWPQAPGMGAEALVRQRCALLGIGSMQTNTVLRGFMLRNSVAGDLYCAVSFDAVSQSYIVFGYGLGGALSGYGGAVCGGTLEYCTLINSEAIFGGGAYASSLKACTVMGNCATNGGGICASSAVDCTLMDNRASDGGGAYNSVLDQCTLAFNEAANNGGGVFGGKIYGSSILDNTAYCGGGVYGGEIDSCLLQYNDADLLGGNAAESRIARSEIRDGAAQCGGGMSSCVVWSSTLENNSAMTGGGGYYGIQTNCLVVGNRADYLGGGLYYGCAVNGTIVNNSAVRLGGGCYSTGLENSIIWDNTVQSGSSSNYYNGTLQVCCSRPLSIGNGNTNVNPQFVGNGDYRLLSSSPCIDYGDNRFASVTADLAGRPRIQNSCVDLGAYEFWPSIEVAGVAVTNAFSSSFLLLTPQSNVWRAVASYMDQNPVLTADELGGKLVNADMLGLTMNDLTAGDNLQNFNPMVNIVQLQPNDAGVQLSASQKPMTLTFTLSTGVMLDRDALNLFRVSQERRSLIVEVYDQVPSMGAQPVETLQPIALTYDETNGTASATVQPVQSYAQAYFRLKMAHLVVDSTSAQ